MGVATSDGIGRNVEDPEHPAYGERAAVIRRDHRYVASAVGDPLEFYYMRLLSIHCRPTLPDIVRSCFRPWAGRVHAGGQH